MFNEAFWFFYAVGLVTSFSAYVFLYTVVGILGFLGAGVFLSEQDYDTREREWPKFAKTFKKFFISVFALMLITFFIPNENALYAGAGQYVAESAEIDETLMKLKDAIDLKIEELTVPEEK